MFPGSNQKEQRLNSLTNKVIIDANILLDASFNLTGFSRKAIVLLNKMGFHLCYDQQIYQEAFNIITKKRRRLGLEYDPVLFLNNLLFSFSFHYIRSKSNYMVRGINKSDQHIARAALENNGFVLTNDCPLYDECKKANIPVRFSWHVINEYNNREDGHPGRGIIKIHQLGKGKGFIFARVIPKSWDSTFTGDNSFTVIEVENTGRLFYKAVEKSWCFKTVSGVTAKVEHDFGRQDIITLLVNYDIEENKLLELRSSHAEHPAHMKLDSLSNKKSAGKVTLGRDNQDQNYLNGIIANIMTGHKNVSKDLFKLLREYKEALPNPWDKGMLDFYMKKSSIQKSDHRHNLIYFKSANSV